MERLKIIQTLFIETTKNPLKSSLGFVSAEFNWMSWALSCLQLKKIYGKVELFTNKKGKQVLIDELQLPYSKVHVVLDKIDFPRTLWAYIKLYTYSIQKEPFLHIDGDVFIWKKLIEPEDKQGLIVQNMEEADHFYRPLYNDLIKKDFELPESVKLELDAGLPLFSINAGIIGGTDMLFFKEYTTQAFKFIYDNLSKFTLINQEKFNMLFEQHLFCCLAKQRNIPITSQLPEVVTDMTYKHLVNFADVPYQNHYVHLVSSYKKSVEVCLLMAKRLRQDYPDYYERIIAQCKKQRVSLLLNCYRTKKSPKEALPEQFKYNTKPKVNWKQLYEAEKEQHQMLELAFCDPAAFEKAAFETAKSITIELKAGKDGQPAIFYHTPYSYLKAFKETEGDELDQAIIELLKGPKKFSELCFELKQFFDEDEMKNEQEAFMELIKLKLKNGCVTNLYYVID